MAGASTAEPTPKPDRAPLGLATSRDTQSGVTARAIGDSAALDPERAFWHMLFPLGGTEGRTEWEQAEGPDGVYEWVCREVEFEFSAEWLQGLVDNHARYREISARHGMPPIPIPVSMQHRIEERIAGWGYEQTLGDLERAGGLHALKVVTDASIAPPGLYGLIQWTPTALRMIDDGTWECLSPTTWWDWDMTSPGVVLEGESIQAVGLVDRGALDSIGTTRDRLPIDAFTAQPVASRSIQRCSTWGKTADLRRTHAPRTVSHDRADGPRHESDMADPTADTTIVPAAEPATEPDQRAEGDMLTEARVGEMIAAACAPLTEAVDGLRAAIDAMAPPEDTTATDEPDVVDMNAVDPVADATAAVVAEAVGAIKAEAVELVRNRRLLPVNVSAYIARSVKGDAVDDLVGNYGAAARMTGDASTGASHGSPDTTSKLTETQAIARAERELGAKADPRAVTHLANKILADAERAGTTVLRGE